MNLVGSEKDRKREMCISFISVYKIPSLGVIKIRMSIKFAV